MKRKMMMKAIVHFPFGGKPVCFKRDSARKARTSSDPKKVTCPRCKQILEYKEQVLKRRISSIGP